VLKSLTSVKYSEARAEWGLMPDRSPNGGREHYRCTCAGPSRNFSNQKMQNEGPAHFERKEASSESRVRKGGGFRMEKQHIVYVVPEVRNRTRLTKLKSGKIGCSKFNGVQDFR